MPTHWMQTLRRRLARWRAGGLGPGWLVGVSGGSDSIALLRALHQLARELNLDLAVAHLNHGVRGESAAADAAFVGDLAGALGLPFLLGHWQPRRPGHFESDARSARYAWLTETAKARGASVVAVGHTRDDQAETILHRIVRGTGIRGLAGMPARRRLDASVTLTRPVLSVTRAELRAFLGELGQPYRDDASNADLSRTRARLRHDLLPKLAEEYNPNVAEALARLGALAGASERGWRRRVLETLRKATASVTRDELMLKRDELLMLSHFLRIEVIRLGWQRAGWPEGGMSARRWERLDDLLRTKHSRTLTMSGIQITNGPLVVLRRATEPPVLPAWPIPNEALPLDLPGDVSWGPGRVLATLDPIALRDESLDLDSLHTPLHVRAPQPGDRFAPLGMGGQSMPLNDFFRGRRVAKERRPCTPLVCDDDGIVWVAGHRIAERVRITPDTQRTVGLRWIVGSGQWTVVSGQ